jgi:hypothetical protein
MLDFSNESSTNHEDNGTFIDEGKPMRGGCTARLNTAAAR